MWDFEVAGPDRGPPIFKHTLETKGTACGIVADVAADVEGIAADVAADEHGGRLGQRRSVRVIRRNVIRGPAWMHVSDAYVDGRDALMRGCMEA